MLLVWKVHGLKSRKDKDILAHKITISFHPDDKVSYVAAFQIAKEFAEMYAHSKGYEVLFAVHTDTDHVHAHFLISNCNFETGKSFRRSQKDLFEMSEYFGEQCLKHGFVNSVRENFYNHETPRLKETFNETQMKKRGAETFKDELREVIKIEIDDPKNRTFDDVIRALKDHYNVECRVAGNTVSYRHPEYLDKNGKPVSVRGSRLGDLYTRKGIEYELNKKHTAGRGANPEQPEQLADYNRVTAELEKFVGADRELPCGNARAGGGQVRNDVASINGLQAVRNPRRLYGERKVGDDKNAERQNEYTESVRAEVSKIVYQVYFQIEQRQKTAIDNMLEQAQKSFQTLEKKADDCLMSCDIAVDNVKKQITEMGKIDSITDILLILAPLSVIGSFVMKIIELFS